MKKARGMFRPGKGGDKGDRGGSLRDVTDGGGRRSSSSSALAAAHAGSGLMSASSSADDHDESINESLKSSGGTSGASDNFHASILPTRPPSSPSRSSRSKRFGGGGADNNDNLLNDSSATAGTIDPNDVFNSFKSSNSPRRSSPRRSSSESRPGLLSSSMSNRSLGSQSRPSYRSNDAMSSSQPISMLSGSGEDASESETSDIHDVAAVFASVKKKDKKESSSALDMKKSSSSNKPAAASAPSSTNLPPPPPLPPPPATQPPTAAASTQKTKHIEESAGTNRLNRILSKSAREEELRDNFLNSNNQNAHPVSTAEGVLGPTATSSSAATAKILVQKVERIHDPRNLSQVSRFVARVVLPPLKIDPTSIGGAVLDAYPVDKMFQETLLTFQCHAFEATSGSEMVSLPALQYPAQYTSHKRRLGLLGSAMGTKGRHKYKYVILARSTTRPLIPSEASPIQTTQQATTAVNLATTTSPKPTKNKQKKRSDGGDDDGDEEESTTRGDYDTMFEQEDLSESMADDGGDQQSTSGDKKATTSTATTSQPQDGEKKDGDKKEPDDEEPKDAAEAAAADDDEVSSFPVFICMTLHSDGSAPDVRKLIPLDQLTTVQDLHSTVVQLAFRNGDTVRLDFGDFQDGSTSITNFSSSKGKSTHASTEKGTVQGALVKERFIWSLLQIHAMLCISVVERSTHQSSGTGSGAGEAGGGGAGGAGGGAGGSDAATSRGDRHRRYLPPLNVRNFDRAQLQYVATVNKFLKRSPVLCALLDRQRLYMQVEGVSSAGPGAGAGAGEEEKLAEMEEMDTLAYAMMMGNFNTRVSLFHSEAERKDAEEVLNSTEWTDSSSFQRTADGDNNATAVSVAERLHLLLQFRMRDLEAETCRRLIAWEDEKHYSSTGGAKLMSGSPSKILSSMDDDGRDTVDALALASLFKTLDSLDGELALMEEWLQDRAAAIKPLTDDCADIEEENRQLEQQWKSYEMLGNEMKRLLQGLELNEDAEKLLKNPASYLVYDSDGLVDVERSEAGVEQIYESGKALQEAIEYPRQSGGLHLKAVSERADKLSSITKTFCTQLAQIIVTVMEQFKTEVVAGSDHGKVSKNDTHSMIAKKIRDTQRKFQSALLGYIKLIEILAALSPEMLPALRDAYAEMVSEGILMKKRCKGYFQALPGKNVAYMNKSWKDLKDYVPGDESIKRETVNAPDLRAALAELLPVIAREAYFTSALFGSSNKDQDGREKKRNFENTRAAVDNASHNFRYYMNRTCGIYSIDSNTGKSTEEMIVKVDPLLNLVASIYLNEAMDNYIDREKKGGDHSLSLAYVRATILDLRKKVDKQWVIWVEKQMEWIRSNDGVPLSGKRAGIVPSFARFPCYIDHILTCCSEGRDEDYVPSIANIKVINYYLQKMAATLLESLKECAARETTDQQYASNVLLMENTFFFTQAMKHRGKEISDLFAKQVTKANAICKESTDAYLGWMIKREFAVLHELFSRVSKIRKEHGDKEVPTHVPKTQFVKTLTKEASREVLKERIASVYIRMGKHLSEEGGLLPVAWKALVKVLYEWFGRWEKLSTAIYRHKLDPSAVDVVRIAKAAGGASKRQSAQGAEFGFKSILALGNKDK